MKYPEILRSPLRRASMGLVVAAIFLQFAESTHTQANYDRQVVLTALDRYEKTATTGPLTFKTVGALTSALDEVGPAWVAASAGPERGRRQLILPLFILDLSLADYRGGSGFSVHRAEMLEWGCEWLRHSAESEFERLWMLASYALMQPAGAGFGDGSKSALAHLAHARERFPNESRLRLAELLLRPAAWGLSNRPGADQSVLIRSPFVRRSSVSTNMPMWTIDRTRRDLEAIAGDPVVGPEARVHLGILDFHSNQVSRSLQTLTVAANDAIDPFVRNLGWLMAGLAHDVQGQEAAATVALERAVMAIPTAKTSATLLATHWFLAGRREQASSLLDRAFAIDPPTLDPWQHVGDMLRFVPGWMAQLHEMAGHGATTIVRMAPAKFDVASSADQTQSDPVARSADWDAQAGPQGLPEFRARTDAVLVDVSVRSGNKPVEGLRPEDLELRDNGFIQTIQSIEKESLPIDLTIVADYFDAGGSVRGVVPGEFSYAEEQRAQLKIDVISIAAILGQQDRVRIIEVENEPYEVVALRSGTLRPPIGPKPGDLIGRLSYMRNSAIYDAVANALMRFTPAGRRHVVLAFTEGVDDGSILTKERLLAVASRADAVLHLSKRKTSTEVAAENALRTIVTPGYSTLLWPPESTVVGAVSKRTGGTEIHSLGGSKYDEIRGLLDRLRESYLVRYQPSTPSKTGWHEIQIRMLKSGKYDVQARKGYWGG